MLDSHRRWVINVHMSMSVCVCVERTQHCLERTHTGLLGKVYGKCGLPLILHVCI